ncbi:hypothetical protein [Anabaena sp. UHCC 0253]|uniref:hypothetical protein n=1 Tax=Anabaena sp. UHCC 0253 TaxID=2590019 RepID=UPI001C2C0743|nr:hypothetical protein [Anabaena sp. UHCC 0253]
MINFLPVNFITCIAGHQLERLRFLQFWRRSLPTNVIAFGSLVLSESTPSLRAIAKSLKMRWLWHFTRVYGQYP